MALNTCFFLNVLHDVCLRVSNIAGVKGVSNISGVKGVSNIAGVKLISNIAGVKGTATFGS